MCSDNYHITAQHTEGIYRNKYMPAFSFWVFKFSFILQRGRLLQESG